MAYEFSEMILDFVKSSINMNVPRRETMDKLCNDTTFDYVIH